MFARDKRSSLFCRGVGNEAKQLLSPHWVGLQHVAEEADHALV